MKKTILSLAILCMSITEHSIAQCPNGSQTITGDNLNITSGNWCLNSGTYTGNISSISSGAVIYIASGASFKPSNLNGGAYGTFNVSGECVLPGTTVYSDFKVNNSGKFTFNSAISVNGTNIQFINTGDFTFSGNLNYNSGFIKVDNRRYAIMRFNAALPIGDNSTVDNGGTLLVQGDLNVNYANSAYYNRGGAVTRISTNFNPKGTALNDGLIVVSALTNVNTPTSFINNCRFVSVTGFVVDGSSNVTNNGLIWVPNGQVQINSSSVFQLGSRSVTRGVDFGNNAKVNGSGKMYFTGTTTQQGSQFAGVSASAPITFYDASQSGTKIFDNENSPYTYTVRTLFTPADTTTFDCTGLILPVQLSGFDAQNIRNKSVLVSWQTLTELYLQKFVVERSLEVGSTNWETIGTVAPANNGTTIRSYQFTDAKPLNGTSYYRLRSVDADGKESISNPRQISMDSKFSSSLQLYPTVVPKGSFVKIITTEPVRYHLLDMSGKTVLSGVLASGANTLSLPINTGSYVIETTNASNVRQHAKLIVQ